MDGRQKGSIENELIRHVMQTSIETGRAQDETGREREDDACRGPKTRSFK
jgi:hypothetical protein